MSVSVSSCLSICLPVSLCRSLSPDLLQHRQQLQQLLGGSVSLGEEQQGLASLPLAKGLVGLTVRETHHPPAAAAVAIAAAAVAYAAAAVTVAAVAVAVAAAAAEARPLPRAAPSGGCSSNSSSSKYSSEAQQQAAAPAAAASAPAAATAAAAAAHQSAEGLRRQQRCSSCSSSSSSSSKEETPEKAKSQGCEGLTMTQQNVAAKPQGLAFQQQQQQEQQEQRQQGRGAPLSNRALVEAQRSLLLLLLLLLLDRAMGVSTCCCCSRPGARRPWRLLHLVCCLVGLAAVTAAGAAAAAAATGGSLLQEGTDRLQLNPEAQLQQQQHQQQHQKQQQQQQQPRIEETAEGQDEICTQNFRDAFNAAVSHVIDTNSSRAPQTRTHQQQQQQQQRQHLLARCERSRGAIAAKPMQGAAAAAAAASNRATAAAAAAAKTATAAGAPAAAAAGQRSRQLTRHLLPLWGQAEAYVSLLSCAPSIPGDNGVPSSSQWPLIESLLPDDLLYQILRRQTVRVAGVAQETGDSGLSTPFKGVGGDYSIDPPRGFFPDYLRALLRAMGQRYGVSLKAEYLFFANVETAQAAVAAGIADITDIYFLHAHKNDKIDARVLGGLAINTSKPLSFLYMSCPVVGAPVFVYTAHQKFSTFEEIVFFLSNVDIELKKGSVSLSSHLHACMDYACMRSFSIQAEKKML
ncbi:hypothetical protein ACSSS7_005412 [Eimeria intestinalis]